MALCITLLLGGFEINLDKHKLKTPNGSLFKVPTEALALGVAAEWNAQTDVIQKSTMHLVYISMCLCYMHHVYMIFHCLIHFHPVYISLFI